MHSSGIRDFVAFVRCGLFFALDIQGCSRQPFARKQTATSRKTESREDGFSKIRAPKIRAPTRNSYTIFSSHRSTSLRFLSLTFRAAGHVNPRRVWRAGIPERTRGDRPQYIILLHPMPSLLICDPMVRGTEKYSAVMQCRPIDPAESAIKIYGVVHFARETPRNRSPNGEKKLCREFINSDDRPVRLGHVVSGS